MFKKIFVALSVIFISQAHLNKAFSSSVANHLLSVGLSNDSIEQSHKFNEALLERQLKFVAESTKPTRAADGGLKQEKLMLVFGTEHGEIIAERKPGTNERHAPIARGDKEFGMKTVCVMIGKPKGIDENGFGELKHLNLTFNFNNVEHLKKVSSYLHGRFSFITFDSATATMCEWNDDHFKVMFDLLQTDGILALPYQLNDHRQQAFNIADCGTMQRLAFVFPALSNQFKSLTFNQATIEDQIVQLTHSINDCSLADYKKQRSIQPVPMTFFLVTNANKPIKAYSEIRTKHAQGLAEKIAEKGIFVEYAIKNSRQPFPTNTYFNDIPFIFFKRSA